MTSYKLVMPGDLNHYGFLFGGKMLMWVDAVSAASEIFCQKISSMSPTRL